MRRYDPSKPAHMTAAEFARQLAQAQPLFEDLPEVCAAYYQLRYGGRPLSRRQRLFIQRLLVRLS